MEVAVGDVVLCKFYFSDSKKFKNRPVLVFKNNLPFDDFVAIPISSKIENMGEDEYLIDNEKFHMGGLVVTSKLMIRKTFVVSKQSIVKKYGNLHETSYVTYHKSFCKYFGCK